MIENIKITNKKKVKKIQLIKKSVIFYLTLVELMTE